MNVDLTATATQPSQPVGVEETSEPTSNRNLVHTLDMLYAHFGQKRTEWSLPLKICAIDCEMCSTEDGLELTRVSVVCPKQGIILDSLVSYKCMYVCMYVCMYEIRYLLMNVCMYEIRYLLMYVCMYV